jgi:peroxiredoxin
MLSLSLSVDTPFARGRFRKTEGVKNVLALSRFWNTRFGKTYGVECAELRRRDQGCFVK